MPSADFSVAITNSDITYNGTGIAGATTSYVNNRIFGNAGPGTTPTAANPGQQ